MAGSGGEEGREGETDQYRSGGAGGLDLGEGPISSSHPFGCGGRDPELGKAGPGKGQES